MCSEVPFLLQKSQAGPKAHTKVERSRKAEGNEIVGEILFQSKRILQGLSYLLFSLHNVHHILTNFSPNYTSPNILYSLPALNVPKFQGNIFSLLYCLYLGLQ